MSGSHVMERSNCCHFTFFGLEIDHFASEGCIFFDFCWLQMRQIDFIPEESTNRAFFSFHFHLKEV